MTAEEIYDIVKDVPKEAWPKKITWGRGGGETGFYRHCPYESEDIASVWDEEAELLFEASMARWIGLHEVCPPHHKQSPFPFPGCWRVTAAS